MVSMMIYPFSPIAIFALAALMVCVTFVGGWLIFTVAPVEVTFLTDHLGRWAEAFAGEVEAATPLPFYTAAASLLAAWITAEIEALGAAPARVGAPDALDAEAAEPFSCPMAPEGPQA